MVVCVCAGPVTDWRTVARTVNMLAAVTSPSSACEQPLHEASSYKSWKPKLKLHIEAKTKTLFKLIKSEFYGFCRC